MKKIVMLSLYAFFVVLCPQVTMSAPLSFSTFSASGIEILPNTDGVAFSLSSFGNEGPNPITLGTFDPHTGDIVNGDAVLVAFLNLGTAPLTRLNFLPGLSVDPSKPFSFGVVASGMILPAETSPYLGFGIGPQSSNAQFGDNGTFYLGFALFTSLSQSIMDVPGLTIPIDVEIGEGTHFIFPIVKSYSYIGGAAQATALAADPIPEPGTLFLLCLGIGVMLVAVRLRKPNERPGT
ncbi:PEP-CTERM sorting domain-containing protein [Geobacter sp.]|uniref:PEP-CTERM sorting domain-containing protein n=1 Tax=Geobacter sp. TaxID=46610 RepID=UPI001AC1C090|nr:PEP-CTERM sorting domain-containing protein [Geobacter sp.]CAG1013754.1 hypothetical protein ANAEL_04791 [Anaerolineales bacterium]